MASNGRELFVADSRDNLIRVAAMEPVPTYQVPTAANDGIRNAPVPVVVPENAPGFAPAVVYQSQRVGDVNIYRYEGELAIPAGGTRNGGNALWIDANGNGKEEPEEITKMASPIGWITGLCVDSKGDLWAANSTTGGSFMRHFAFKGLTAKGVPLYSGVAGEGYEDVRFPEEGDKTNAWGMASRMDYDADRDILVAFFPAVARKGEGDKSPAQYFMARYDNWSKGNRAPRWKVKAFRPETDPDYFMYEVNLYPYSGYMGMQIAGDYVFFAYLFGEVHVFDLASGKLVEILALGPEVNGQSAWEDAAMGLRAFKRRDGEYLIFTENSGRGSAPHSHLPALDVIGARAPQVSVLIPILDSALARDMETSGFLVETGQQAPMEQFNTVVLYGPPAGGADKILSYVKDGGGLLITGTIMSQDTERVAWNTFLKPLGVEYAREVVVDPKNSYTNKHFSWQWPTYAWTTNLIKDSPVTKGIATVWYPSAGKGHFLQNQWYGNHAMTLDANWQVLVKGMDSAVSVPLDESGCPSLSTPGLWKTQPPLFAVRTYGKGRIAIFPSTTDFHFAQGNTLMVEGVVLKNGDGRRKSDTQKLLFNSLRWLSALSLQAGRPGGYKPKPRPSAVAAPEAITQPVNWSDWKKEPIVGLDAPYRNYMGLIGAHSSLSGGRGTAEENIKAAREAGYDFIAFTEDLSRVDEKQYRALQAECKRLSDDTFLAMPGLELTMANGTHRLLVDCPYPEARFLSGPERKIGGEGYVFFAASKFCGTVIYDLSHQPLTNGWFYPFYNCLAVQTYRGGQLVDDSITEYLHLQENSASLIPVTIHLTYGPDEIRKARATGMQTYVKICPQWHGGDWRIHVPQLLGFGEDGAGFFRVLQWTYVSSGPQLAGTGFGYKGDLPRNVSTCDRFSFAFRLQSDTPLKEVLVRDGKRIHQRFLPLPSEKNRMTRQLEEFHSKQWDWIVDAQDEKGGRLISSCLWTRVQRNFNEMCGDEQNILGHSGLYFKGWSGITGFPPHVNHHLNVGAWGDATCLFNEFCNVYPFPDVVEASAALPPDISQVHPYAEAHLALSAGEITRVEMNYQWLASWGRSYSGPFPLPPHPRCEAKAVASVWFQSRPSRDMNNCYDSDKAGVAMVSVHLKTKKALKPSASVSPNLLLLWLDADSGERNHLTYLNREGKEVTKVRDSEDVWVEGSPLANPGYAAFYPGFAGSLGIVSLNPNGCVKLHKDKAHSRTAIILGCRLPAGEVAKDAEFEGDFLILRGKPGLSADEFMNYFRRFIGDFGLAGAPRYVVAPQSGKVVSSRYVLTLEAADYGFRGKIPRADLCHEVLPVVVNGLNDNWDAGCYEKNTKWLKRIPVQQGKGYLSLDPWKGDRDFYAGNLLACDRPDMVLRLLDSRKDRLTFTAHNPTGQALTCTVRTPDALAECYSIPKFKKTITVPAGTTIQRQEFVK
jgi:hypothetical protein